MTPITKDLSKVILRLFAVTNLRNCERESSMKIERWHDVKCNFCGRYLSTDFMCGMQPKREWAEQLAKKKGFKTRNGQNICPVCLEEKK